MTPPPYYTPPGQSPWSVCPDSLLILFNYLLVSPFTSSQEAVRTAQPIFLFYLLSYFTPGSSLTKLEAYLNAMGITLAAILSVILHQLYFFHGHRTGMHIRIATNGCVYRKVSAMCYDCI